MDLSSAFNSSASKDTWRSGSYTNLTPPHKRTLTDRQQAVQVSTTTSPELTKKKLSTAGLCAWTTFISISGKQKVQIPRKYTNLGFNQHTKRHSEMEASKTIHDLKGRCRPSSPPAVLCKYCSTHPSLPAHLFLQHAPCHKPDQTHMHNQHCCQNHNCLLLWDTVLWKRNVLVFLWNQIMNWNGDPKNRICPSCCIIFWNTVPISI